MVFNVSIPLFGGSPIASSISDRKTRFHIRIESMDSPMAYLNFTAAVDGGVTIDWGDGETSASSGTDNAQYSHSYSAVGDYTIELTADEGIITLGSGGEDDTDSHVPAFGPGTTEDSTDEKAKLRAVEIGKNVASIGARAFKNCAQLASATIVNSVAALKLGIFCGCTGLTSVTIPSSVGSIGGWVFQYCSNVTEYHLLRATPPALDSYCFADGGISGDCIIYVPAGTLSAYQAATNWGKYSDYMKEESE